MNIGERIKYLRKDILHIKSQEVFAKQINISRSNLGNIETSRVSVTDRVISDICSTYNVNENWLMTIFSSANLKTVNSLIMCRIC